MTLRYLAGISRAEPFSEVETALRKDLVDDLFGLYGLKGWDILTFQDTKTTSQDADAILGVNENPDFQDEYMFDVINFVEVFKRSSLLEGIDLEFS